MVLRVIGSIGPVRILASISRREKIKRISPSRKAKSPRADLRLESSTAAPTQECFALATSKCWDVSREVGARA